MARKKTKFTLRNLLYDKRFTFPASIILSVILWVVITVTQNPTRNQVISDVTVNISTENTAVKNELGLDIISGGQGIKVNVEVNGPSYVVSTLTATDVLVTASLSEVKGPGKYDLPLTAKQNSSKSNYDIISVTPSILSVVFDNIDSVEYTVVPRVTGISAAPGLLAQEGVISDEASSRIKITGPRTEMKKISSAMAVVDVNKTLSVTESFDGRIALFDSTGAELNLSPFTLEFETVKVTVPISKSKELPIVPKFMNLPPAYTPATLNHTLSVPSLTVLGPPEIVDTLTEIELEPIDFDAVGVGQTSFNCKLNLPAAVKSMDNIQTVTVTIGIGNLKERSFNISEFIPVNLEAGRNATVGRILKNVTIVGPSASVRAVAQSDLYAEVNLAGKQPGEYTVEARIKVRNHGDVWQLGTYNVIVTVS